MIRRLALAAALALASAPLFASTYLLETRHTQGVIRWNHLGFSNPTAQFSQVEGTLEFDPANPTKASVTATITLANLTSGVPDLDEDFRAARFFDMAQFPTATFKSTRVEQGSAPDRLRVTGDLSLRGVTRPVVLDVTINKVGTNIRSHLPSVGFEALTTLKRSDFGLGAFVPQVSDEVQIHITSEAEESKAYVAKLKADAAEAAKNSMEAAKEVEAAEAALKR
ncbi:YceI family protein [Dyella subtropica]|uniref:YceI family protein n=1 Tax=Dyella subtropica TaxID=2992127 RepID=UPI002252534A|nr:YceI family protein [Dyella subtropica]